MTTVRPKVSLRFLIATLLLSSALVAQEHVRAVIPSQMAAHTNRFYSPGVDAGDYLYVSGQGPRKPDGSLPATFSDQVRQVLDNIQAVVESAGLTMDHVVYIQVYLEDIAKFEELTKTISEFGKSQPAQAVLGVARAPESPRQMNAVAVRSLADKKPVYPPNYRSDDPAPPGMLTHDRLFVSSMSGSDPATGKVPNDPASQVDLALDRVEAVVRAAGLELRNMVFVNPYLTTDMPMRVMNEHYARRFEFGNTPALHD